MNSEELTNPARIQNFSFETLPVYAAMTSKDPITVSAEQYTAIQKRLHKEYSIRNIQCLEGKLKDLETKRTEDIFGIGGSLFLDTVGVSTIAYQAVDGYAGALVTAVILGVGTWGTIQSTKDLIHTYSSEHKQNILDARTALSRAQNR